MLLNVENSSTANLLFLQGQNKEKRYGILGGTFDPVHHGHLLVAEFIREKCKLDRIVFVPTGLHPHKTGDSAPIASPQNRYEMLLLATKGNKYFSVWDYEVKKKTVSYSIETMKELKKLLPKVTPHFIVGTDALSEVLSWKSPQELLLNYDIIVCNRGKEYNSSIEDVKKEVPEARLHPLTIPCIEISATDIRNRLARGQSINYFTPIDVVHYIKSHSLYIK